MGRFSLSSLRRGTTLLAIVLLAVSGPAACGLAGPFPAHPREEADPRASGTDVASEPPLVAQAPGDATTPNLRDPAPSHLLLRLGERRLYLMYGDVGTPVESFPIAVGREGLETPTGRFHVEEMVENPEYLVVNDGDPARVVARIPPGPANPLGARWIGFAHGDGWTVGIHGTPHPEFLGRAISQGCVRMRNADVIRVYDRVQLGTTVIVLP